MNYLPCNVIKKYLPYILLIAAAALFFWVRSHQRGPTTNRQVNTEIPAVLADTAQHVDLPFDRDISHIRYTKHARCRMDCREIDESEVKEIIQHGEINYSKVEEDKKGKTYPLEGITHDKQHVRIVVAPHERELVIVTVIDLEKEWQCNCN